MKSNIRGQTLTRIASPCFATVTFKYIYFILTKYIQFINIHIYFNRVVKKIVNGNCRCY